MHFPRVFASRLRGELPYFPRSYERGYGITCVLVLENHFVNRV